MAGADFEGRALDGENFRIAFCTSSTVKFGLPMIDHMGDAGPSYNCRKNEANCSNSAFPGLDVALTVHEL